MSNEPLMPDSTYLSCSARIAREDLEGLERRHFRTARGTRPDLTLVEVDGSPVVVKDFRGSDRLFRLIVAPFLVRRERAALLKLKGVSGIPQYVADIDGMAFAVEYAPGVSLDNIEPPIPTGDRGGWTTEIPAEFFALLEETVRQMHARGVAHCDLRSRGNVILSADGQPFIVDFAACVLRGRGLNPFVNWLFARFCEADENAILRIKKRLAPHLLTKEEEESLARPMPLERPAILIGRTIRNLTRSLLTDKRKK